MGPGVQIKAAGGIADLRDAEEFLALGASRLGTSRVVKAVKALEAARHVGPGVQIKAAGGIADLRDAEEFLALGASRLGTSRVVKAVKALEAARN